MPIQPADFAHLHVHSEYSLLDGANKIKAMVAHAKSLGQTALAITDHGVMFGVLEFHQECKKAGIRPIIGCEVYITAGHRTERAGREQRAYNHLLLLATDYEGYKNLGRLSTIGFTEGFYYKPRIDFETLAKHSAGLVATTSCMSGLIPQAILDGVDRLRDDYYARFIEIFGKERFFVEVQDHGIPEQRQLNRALFELAKREGLKVVASNDAHYMRREDASLHDLLLCIQTGACVHDANRMKFHGNEFYLKSAAEMERVFGDAPESLTNTLLVAEMCNVEMPKQSFHLPKFSCPGGIPDTEHLRAEVERGARRFYQGRADTDAELRERIAFELGVIERMGFASYFLIVADFIAHARSQGIPVGPGRGSAAGSVVAYCLGITQLCPLEHGLLFERFLNPDRLSMPDIDVDFCFERRGEVIEYVRRKYGSECVSQIITFGTMKAKLAVRDVGRALGMPLPVVDKVAKLVPDGPKVTLKDAFAESAELKALADSDPQIKTLMDNAAAVEGYVRHAGTHAAGIVIADRDLTEYCALYKHPKEQGAATQFTMGQVEELGLLKMDFLGIKNLTIIARVERWLKEREGIELDWDKVPLTDPATYALLQAGKTGGVFQLESSGMTNLVRAMKPTEFADLTALLALYRPGPLEAGMHTMYVNRKHGREPVEYEHPVLEPILRESYGTILYQEQVMRISMDMCGFTRGEADVLRKAMGKKKADVMEQMRAKFVAGAEKTCGIDAPLAEAIWNNIVTFAGYGFNKSHSAAYAVITFRTAYLRAHHPVHFLAALLTNEIGGSTDAIAKYVSECRDSGVEVLPPDVNKSFEHFNKEGGAIRYGLAAVKTVGEGFAKAVVEERAKNGAFQSTDDFFSRIDPAQMNVRMVEALVKVGAFDSLEKRRAGLAQALPELMESAARSYRERKGGQASLFEALGAQAEAVAIPIPKVPEWDSKARANFEREFLGFYLTEHPLSRFRLEFESFATHRSSQLEELAGELSSGKDSRDGVRMIGVVTALQIRADKNGRPWAIVSMEDTEGSFEVKVWSRAYDQVRALLVVDAVLWVECRASLWNGRMGLEAQQAAEAATLRERARTVRLEWSAAAFDDDACYQLKELCRRSVGKRSVQLVVTTPDGAHTVELRGNGALKLDLTDETLGALARLPGKPALRLVAG